ARALAEAERADLSAGARETAPAAVREGLDAGAVAALEAIAEARGLVQAVIALHTFRIVRADQRARRGAAEEEEKRREEPHLARVSPLVARQTHALGQRSSEQIAHLSQPRGHRLQVELLRVEARLDLAPAQGGGDGGAGGSP